MHQLHASTLNNPTHINPPLEPIPHFERVPIAITSTTYIVHIRVEHAVSTNEPPGLQVDSFRSPSQTTQPKLGKGKQPAMYHVPISNACVRRDLGERWIA